MKENLEIMKIVGFTLCLMVKFISSRYQQCSRGSCHPVGDLETEFSFDQPEPFYLDSKDGKLREELVKTGLGAKYNVTKEKEQSYVVNKDIHMIWVGSPLPAKYVRGPVTFSHQNPSYKVHLWLDHHTLDRLEGKGWVDKMELHDINKEEWTNGDLVKQATNYAMISDILRLEIIYRHGGIYTDIDSVAKRPFGPIFTSSFVTFIPENWTKDSNSPFNKVKFEGEPVGYAGIQNSPFGFPKSSSFLHFAMTCLRINFPQELSTIWRTGPVFFKQTFLQYNDTSIQLISWDFTGQGNEDAIVYDNPGDCNWDDGDDIANNIVVRPRLEGIRVPARRTNQDLVARIKPWWKLR